MFLALLASRRDADIVEVSVSLLGLMERHLPDHRLTAGAMECWDRGLHDDTEQPQREQSRREYVVFRYAEAAFDSYPEPSWSGGGASLVCAAVRRVAPLAPSGFSRVGKQEGVLASSVPADADRVVSCRALFARISGR